MVCMPINYSYKTKNIVFVNHVKKIHIAFKNKLILINKYAKIAKTYKVEAIVSIIDLNE